MAIFVSVILLFLGLGFLVFIHVCIVVRVFRRGFGSIVAIERDTNGSINSSKFDLEKLPLFDYIAKDGVIHSVDCAVCLENFKMGEKCRLLPICKHSFHAQCVDTWLLQTPICPICRTSADYQAAGSGLGQESSHFDGYNVDELRHSQRVETSQMSDIRID